MRIKSLLGCLVAGCAGLIIAALLVPGFDIGEEFSQSVKTLLLAGVLLGLINFFIKPIINLITFPLRWLTFGLFSLVINILIVWAIDIIFSPELSIIGFKALFLTALLVWLVNFLVPRARQRRRRRSRRAEAVEV